MPSEIPGRRPGETQSMASPNALEGAIRDHLESRKNGIFEEIRNYPPPIPACDAQFNFLLEERNRISGELARLDKLLAARLSPEESAEKLASFMEASPFIDGETAGKLRTISQGNLPKPDQRAALRSG